MSIAFDDIDAINGHASEEYGDWGAEIEVTQEMINAFAELTGDRQWIHVDVERCIRESPFGGPIAHGYLTMSLMPMLIKVYLLHRKSVFHCSLFHGPVFHPYDCRAI